ncbi:nitroreductase/quinone reductase family protein [Mycobacteroides sp. LB1]|uniref:nitroreductase/quinone reductase family protein n=1 Tax=Mycobacteroides sp. LB1 TaxID=2750814 RepID=UPI0015DF93A9|nr:nitroreductase family deazaflavin-dependent oxidoreductase [Mycobacteroides sp. LB1]
MNDHPTIPEPINIAVRALLQSPLHWTMSHNTMLLAITGRRTGTAYRVPVSYSRDDNDLVCFTDSPWWINLRGGAAVAATIRGRWRNGTAQVTYGPAITEHLTRHIKLVPRDAKYHSVQLDPKRQPNAADIARAAEVTAMIRVQSDEPRQPRPTHINPTRRLT